MNWLLLIISSDIAWDDIPTRFQMHQDTFAMVNGLRKIDGNVLNLEQAIQVNKTQFALYTSTAAIGRRQQ